MNKYINTDPVTKEPLSRMSCALLLPLILLCDENNKINKKKFTKSVGWINDYRTWDKYWTELVNHNLLVQTDKHTWMVSPHECYGGKSQSVLIHKWNEARNAIS